MSKDTSHDVMESLLSDKVVDESPEIEQLNCLIYSDVDDPLDDADNPEDHQSWDTENDKLKIQVWETKGRIRIRLSPKSDNKISLQRLGEIALNAIMEDLKKDTP